MSRGQKSWMSSDGVHARAASSCASKSIPSRYRVRGRMLPRSPSCGMGDALAAPSGGSMFVLSEDQSSLVEAARAAAVAELAATVKADDEAELYRRDLFEKLGDAGLCGVQTAERWGG